MTTISKEMAYKCATALVQRHNHTAQNTKSDSVIIISFRSLYEDLCALGHPYMIASAIRPANPKNLPLFPKK